MWVLSCLLVAVAELNFFRQYLQMHDTFVVISLTILSSIDSWSSEETDQVPGERGDGPSAWGSSAVGISIYIFVAFLSLF